MSHSNTSLNCFASCMKKYEHMYILHTPSDLPPTPHIEFGIMAHDVLYRMGMARDFDENELALAEHFENIVPSELLYPELKEYFKINSWHDYFKAVCQQVIAYELQLVKEMNCPVEIKRELRMQLTVDQLKEMGYCHISQPLTGIIDLLILGKDSATIVDYKFSTKVKTQDDFDMNSQLPLYALFVSKLYHIPIHNIRIGYIDIPKSDGGRPVELSNGFYSRSKSQAVLQECFEEAIKQKHGDDPYYNCKPGGYYYDTYCALSSNKAAYLNVQYIDEDAYKGIVGDLLDAASMIDIMRENHMKFVKKYDSYSCKNCEFLSKCKPWTTVNWE